MNTTGYGIREHPFTQVTNAPPSSRRVTLCWTGLPAKVIKATLYESTKHVERASQSESTISIERAKFEESTKWEERAIIIEGTT